MKKLTLGLSVLCLCAALSGCGSNPSSTADSSSVEQSIQTESSSEVTTVAASEATDAVESAAPSLETDATKEEKEALRNTFLLAADEVIIEEDSVTFTDNSGKEEPVTIAKNPQKVANLYGSFTTLWYEAGGTVASCIGGKSTIALYEEYIGRDITADEGVTVVADSSAGKNWDVETIIAQQPDLIICSTAMKGYDTISAPAEAAQIPLIAVSYNDFSDYLKWFKVFCNLTGKPELWDEIAMTTLDEVVDVLVNAPKTDNPRVFSMFASSDSLTANTSNTVLGGMITALNGINIVDEWDNPTGADRLDINLETVYAADPDIILIQCHSSEEEEKAFVEEQYGSNEVWNSLSAVKNGQVYYLEKSLYHNKPNRRFAEAYQKLAKLLYPEAY